MEKEELAVSERASSSPGRAMSGGHDAVVVGSGPNLAWPPPALAQAGISVLVLERLRLRGVRAPLS